MKKQGATLVAPCFLYVLYLVNASAAYTLAADEYHVVCISAENAGGLVFGQNDLILVGENFNGVFFLDVHGFSDFHGKHDPAQLVYLANDSR